MEGVRGRVVGVTLALVVGACGGVGTTTTVSTGLAGGTTTTVSPKPSTSPPPTSTPATSPPATSTTSTVSTTTSSASSTTLAGEPVDFGPRAGDVLAVMGVRFDDVLNVRAGPGTDQPVVATLAPTSSEAVATGHTRALPRSFWTEVTVDGVTGWASFAFLAYLGATDDLTAAAVDALGEVPTAATMEELGMIVAGTQASEEPRSELVVVESPTTGDPAEVTVDAVGLGDDALRGLRLHVVGRPVEGGGGFSLESVEVTFLCGRGVTADGFCL